MRRKDLPKRHWTPEHWWGEWERRSAARDDLVRVFVGNGVKSFRELIADVERLIPKTELEPEA